MKWVTMLGAATSLTACVASSGTGRLNGSRSLNDTPHGYQIVTTQARAGAQSQRFEVRSGDCGTDQWGTWNDCDKDRERSEISIDRRWQNGDNIWISYSIFLPEDFETSSLVRTTVGQIHQSGGNSPRGTAGGLTSFPPVMQMEMKGNRYFMRVHMLSGPIDNVIDDLRDFDLIDVSSMRGSWTDVVINFDTSNETDVLEVYINGRRRAKIEGWINFIPEEYYFKYGIYRSFVSRHNGPMPIQVLYIDEVRMGSSIQEVIVNEKQPVD